MPINSPIHFTRIFRFNRLKPHIVLDRLVFRKHYGMAIQIAKHLKLPESRILEHWAFHKVTYDKSKHCSKTFFFLKKKKHSKNHTHFQ